MLKKLGGFLAAGGFLGAAAALLVSSFSGSRLAELQLVKNNSPVLAAFGISMPKNQLIGDLAIPVELDPAMNPIGAVLSTARMLSIDNHRDDLRYRIRILAPDGATAFEASGVKNFESRNNSRMMSSRITLGHFKVASKGRYFVTGSITDRMDNPAVAASVDLVLRRNFNVAADGLIFPLVGLGVLGIVLLMMGGSRLESVSSGAPGEPPMPQAPEGVHQAARAVVDQLGAVERGMAMVRLVRNIIGIGIVLAVLALFLAARFFPGRH